MTFIRKGEFEVEKGFGLPRHTTSTRLAYTPHDIGYEVYDTDLKKKFVWNGNSWDGVSSEDYVDDNFLQLSGGTLTGNLDINNDADTRLSLRADVGGDTYHRHLIDNELTGLMWTDETAVRFRYYNDGSTFSVGSELRLEDGLAVFSTPVRGGAATQDSDNGLTLVTKDYLDGFLKIEGGVVNGDLTVGDGVTNQNPKVIISSPDNGNPFLEFFRDGALVSQIIGLGNRLSLRKNTTEFDIHDSEIVSNVRVRGVDSTHTGSFTTRGYVDTNFLNKTTTDQQFINSAVTINPAGNAVFNIKAGTTDGLTYLNFNDLDSAQGTIIGLGGRFLIRRPDDGTNGVTDLDLYNTYANINKEFRGVTPTASSNAKAFTTKDYVDTQIASSSGSYVDLTTNQVIGGVKTFTNNATFNGLALNNVFAADNSFVFASSPIRLSSAAELASTNSRDLITKSYVDGNFMPLAGNSTKTGNLTLEQATYSCDLIIDTKTAGNSRLRFYRDGVSESELTSLSNRLLITHGDNSFQMYDDFTFVNQRYESSRHTVASDNNSTLTTKGYVDSVAGGSFNGGSINNDLTIDSVIGGASLRLNATATAGNGNIFFERGGAQEAVIASQATNLLLRWENQTGGSDTNISLYDDYVNVNKEVRSSVLTTDTDSGFTLTTKSYVNGLDDQNVKITGSQSVAGNKTFTSQLKLEYDTPILVIKQGQANQSTNLHFRDDTDKIVGDMYVESSGDKRLIIRKRDGTTVHSGLILNTDHVASIGKFRSQDTLDTDPALTLTTKNYVNTRYLPLSGGTVTGNMIISGNLTVNGTTTTVNSNEVNIGDAIIKLNSDETGTPSQDGGIEIERGTATNALLVWNEANDVWTAGISGSLQNIVLNNDSRLSNARTPTAHTHNASDINTGTLDALRIPDLDASKIATGTLANGRISSASVTQHLDDYLDKTETSNQSIAAATLDVNTLLASGNIGASFNIVLPNSSSANHGQVIFRRTSNTELSNIIRQNNGASEISRISLGNDYVEISAAEINIPPNSTGTSTLVIEGSSATTDTLLGNNGSVSFLGHGANTDILFDNDKVDLRLSEVFHTRFEKFSTDIHKLSVRPPITSGSETATSELELFAYNGDSQQAVRIAAAETMGLSYTLILPANRPTTPGQILKVTSAVAQTINTEWTTSTEQIVHAVENARFDFGSSANSNLMLLRDGLNSIAEFSTSRTEGATLTGSDHNGFVAPKDFVLKKIKAKIANYGSGTIDYRLRAWVKSATGATYTHIASSATVAVSGGDANASLTIDNLSTLINEDESIVFAIGIVGTIPANTSGFLRSVTMVID